MFKSLRNKSQWNLLKFDISGSDDGKTAVVDEAGAVAFGRLWDRSGAISVCVCVCVCVCACVRACVRAHAFIYLIIDKSFS